MTMKQFQTAARRGQTAVANPVDVSFEWEATEGTYVEMVAHPPTTGQMALFLSHQLDTGTGGVRAMFDLLSTVLEPGQYRIIENQLRDGLDVDVVIEVVRYLIAEWSARPTQPPSGSSPSRRSTGVRSTVRQRPVVSTTSN